MLARRAQSKMRKTGLRAPLPACVIALTATARAECLPPTTLVDFPIAHAIGAKWNGNIGKLAYGRPQKDGHYLAYLNDIAGAHEERIHNSLWRDDRHQFPATWHPSGRYLVMTVEKPEHAGSSIDAIPGYGGYSDYWIVTGDGVRAWKLVETPNDRDHAITHAAFSPDGTRFVWTERIKAPSLLNASLFAGAYQFNVADFVDDDVPHLAAIHSIVPGGTPQGGEVEAMANDDRTIAFYSTYRSKNLFASRIYTMATESGEITELTTESWSQAPAFTPDGTHIIYMSGAHADVFPWSLQGSDWWIMRRDGSNKQRLTYMNKRGNVQSVGQFRLAGSVTFISDSRFLGDVMTKSLGLTGKIVDVTIQTDCINR
jgi:WD40-like Beta Propeller Repeat